MQKCTAKKKETDEETMINRNGQDYKTITQLTSRGREETIQINSALEHSGWKADDS